MTDTPTLTLYNSLTRSKEEFTPQDPSRVTMYNCGPTVYSYAHIGNARAAVVADVLFRVLRHIYPEREDWKEGEDPRVIYARNITDVDDKIIKAAKAQNVPISEITEKYAKIYQDDLRALGCLDPSYEPKCTEHISHMIEMISYLIGEEFAYISDGHVFFDVSQYKDYGKLSGNTLDALRGGDRVGEGEVARKRNAADFVLWKPELDGVGWDAEFGRGRPGWHIECSAMAKATLGEVIDIHCGGVDLKFPHHENEIAQSCCANDRDEFAKFWVHNEFLNMGSEKMSKSLGNVTLVHDLLKDWDGEVIRLALLNSHYRNELSWSVESLRESKEHLDKWYRILKRWKYRKATVCNPYPIFIKLLYRDMNYVSAIKIIQQAQSSLVLGIKPFESFMPAASSNENIVAHGLREEDLQNELSRFVSCYNLLGLLQRDPEDWFSGGASESDKAKIDALVAEYDSVRAAAMTAKAAGDKAAMGAAFARSDELRDQFKEDGIVLETGADGSTWRKA